ncbi:MAG: hypothetical protein HUJ97_05125 [Bacteroidales bacterium]|nr:hypothetical protein [Bacteroidales bacterium]
MSYLSLVIGFVGILVWLFLFLSLFCFKFRVDRYLTKGNYMHIFLLIALVCIMPFSISLVATCFDIQPYDLLYDDNLYGRGSDIEAKLEYRNNILDRINEEVDDPSLVGTVYHHFRGIGDIYKAGTPKGRYWAFFIGAIGIIFIGGLILPFVLQVVSRSTNNYLEGRTRYNIQKSPFAVIFGAHETVPDIIHKIFSKNHSRKIKYVIVHTDSDVKEYRHELESHLNTYEKNHVIIYCGSRTNPSEIKKLHLERAKEVYVLGETQHHESESDHDSMNMECIRIMAQTLKDKKCNKPLLCYTLLDYQTTIKAFFYSDLNETIKHQIEFVFMNYYSLWAQNVMSRPQSLDPDKIKYLPLEGTEKIDKDCEKFVHLVIVGMTKMGIAMAEEAAYIAHYPNFATKKIRTRITFIDSNAELESSFFMSHHPDYFHLCRWRKVDMSATMPSAIEWNDNLNKMAQMKREGVAIPFDKYPYSHLVEGAEKDSNFMDIEWEFLQGGIQSENVKEYLKQCATDEQQLLTIAVCRSNSQESIATGVYMPIEVYRNAVQVLVFQKQSADIINNISGKSIQQDKLPKMRYQKLRPFGMLSECFSTQIVDNRLAKLVNYVYNNKKDTKLECAEEIEPGTQMSRQEVCWRNCLVSGQFSSINNALSITTKLRFLGLDFRNSSVLEMTQVLRDEKNLEILTEVEHNRWNTEKLLMGYRPLNDKEIVPFIEKLSKGADPSSLYGEKNALKTGWEMAHLNICSFETLKKYDAPAVEYDVVMTKAFPAIVEWMREYL